MPSFRALALAVFALLAPVAAGCSAADSGSDESTTSAVGEDELRSALIGKVSAVRINGGALVAAPGKVQRILEGTGLGPKATRPPEGGLRCPPSYRLEFLDAKGVVKAQAGFDCNAMVPGGRKNVEGTVQVSGKSFLVTAGDIDAIDAIGSEPVAIGDVLFGVDRVQITKPAQAGVAPTETTDGGLVARAVRAINGDQIPDPYARLARCLPGRNVAFFRGGDQVGSASFACVDAQPGVVSGSFVGRDGRTNGGVTVDASAILDVESQATP